MTQVQGDVVSKLKKHGFQWDQEVEGAEPGTVEVLMSKQNRYWHDYAEVEADGSVNGEPLDSFLVGLEEC